MFHIFIRYFILVFLPLKIITNFTGFDFITL